MRSLNGIVTPGGCDDSRLHLIARHAYLAEVGWTTIRVAAGDRRPGIIGRLYRAWNRLDRQARPLTLR